METKMCLEISDRHQAPLLKKCDDTDYQRWEMENYDFEKMAPELKTQAMNLQNNYNKKRHLHHLR